MKIIAGKFKGRNLEYRSRRGLRVTSQKVKEAIFSMLNPVIQGAEILDVYCGYGSLGLEAISRGAKHVTFVDIDGQSLKQLNFFLEKLEVKDQATLTKRDAIKAIKHMDPERYDIIIMDPPYHLRCEEKTLEVITKSGILKEKGMCVVEHYSDNNLPDRIGQLEKVKNKIYGDTAVSIYMIPGFSSGMLADDGVEKNNSEGENDA